MYAVKANDIVRDVVIHKYPCGHIKKGNGPPGKFGQVHWYDFDLYEQALNEARKWQVKGYKFKHCSFCLQHRQ